jgi:hypothetical protein
MKNNYLKNLIFIFIVSIFSLNTSCSNFFEPLSKKDSDAALKESATKKIDSGDYDGAITDILSMSSSYQAKTEIKEALAGAYAGKCGLDFISFVQGLGSGASSAFFGTFMGAFKGITVHPASCALAESVMMSIGTSSTRTGDQNLFMAILAMAKVGTYLRSLADTDSTGNLGDGAADTTFSICSSSAPGSVPVTSLAPFYVSDANMAQIITGMSQMLDNIASVTAVISGSTAVDALDQFKTTCNAIPGSPCSVFDPDAVTAPMIAAFRKLIDTAAIGIGSCPDATGALCCP